MVPCTGPAGTTAAIALIDRLFNAALRAAASSPASAACVCSADHRVCRARCSTMPAGDGRNPPAVSSSGAAERRSPQRRNAHLDLKLAYFGSAGTSGEHERQRRGIRHGFEPAASNCEPFARGQARSRPEHRRIRGKKRRTVDVGVVLERRPGQDERRRLRLPAIDDRARVGDAIFGRYARHPELPLNLDRQQRIDVDRARPDCRGQSGNPETVEMKSRIFVSVEQKYGRLPAFFLKRRRSETSQLRVLAASRSRETSQGPEPT